MTGSWISNQEYFPYEAVELGRLVSSTKNPSDDFYTTYHPRSSDRFELQEMQYSNKNASTFSLILSKIFTARLNHHVDDSIMINNCTFTQYTLRNSSNLFDNICKTTAGQDWMERRAGKGHKKIYLIVGIKTIKNTRITHGNSVIISQDMKGSVAGTVGSSADIDVGCSCTTHSNTGCSFLIQKELVYAIKFRKVIFKRFSNRDPKKASLEDGNRWKVYIGGRGDDENEPDDILCAKLEDGLSVADLEEEHELVLVDNSGEEMWALKKSV